MYYSKFVPQLAKIAEPLHHLTRKETRFYWSPECQQSFENLEARLSEAPVPILAYPSFERDFVLETDASLSGLGAVLSQEQSDGKSHPIAYVSRGTCPS